MRDSPTPCVDEQNPKHTEELPKPQSVQEKILRFSACFFGLQFSYLLWGIMQEKIMSTKYNPTPLSPSGMFPSATFCVFSNRFLGIIVAAIACYWKYGTITTPAPLTSFAPSALSNTLSSWAQYQALSYVSFSLQTIFKSTKLIPVMIMGYVVKGTKYSLVEMTETMLITTGVLIFSMSRENWANNEGAHRDSVGFLLLCVYVITDSFNSQWQSKLYRDYRKMDDFQMILGVNVLTITFTVSALILSGELTLVWEFFTYNPDSMWYNVITAVTSTSGQFFIFFTIKKFGPVTLAIIMATRQMVSMAISNLLFHHEMTLQMYLGALMVFSVVLYTSYRQLFEEAPRKHTPLPVKDKIADVEEATVAAGGGR